jgi:hypothetical protein
MEFKYFDNMDSSRVKTRKLCCVINFKGTVFYTVFKVLHSSWKYHQLAAEQFRTGHIVEG